ncbi:amidohydrolase family protein [Saccharopolyspora sp. 5N102]|uniref:amidohydrolase family protein n=1 Tax=Saccharopolyspora sp. 5N102 TaxID=3375155 RepID=UPI00379A815E
MITDNYRDPIQQFPTPNTGGRWRTVVAPVVSALAMIGVLVLRRRLVELLGGMAASGLTGGNVMDGTESTLNLLAQIEDETDLPVRLRLAPWCMPGDDIDERIALQGRRGRRWEVAAVKFFIDGTVEGGTAWLEHADCLGQNTDALWLDTEEYTEAVRRFAVAKVQTATHAIGDAGVRHVVDGFQGVETHGVRHRIEHLETLPIDQVRRLVATGLVASMQPSHTAYTKADHSDAWSTRLGTERANRAWRCRDVRESGGILVLGSDWPIAGYDAREVLGFARLRRRPGTDIAPVTPEQALTGLMALEGMTTQAAIADGTASHAVPDRGGMPGRPDRVRGRPGRRTGRRTRRRPDPAHRVGGPDHPPGRLTGQRRKGLPNRDVKPQQWREVNR